MRTVSPMIHSELGVSALVLALTCACGPSKGFTTASEDSVSAALESAAALPGCNVIVDLPQETPVTPPGRTTTVPVRFFVNRSACAGDFRYELVSGAKGVWTYPQGWPESGSLALTEEPSEVSFVYTPAENTQYADDLRIRIAPLNATSYPKDVGRIAGITIAADSDKGRNPCFENRLGVKSETRAYCTLRMSD